MRVIARGSPSCLLAQPHAAGRRLNFRNDPRGSNSVRQHSHARRAQTLIGRRLGCSMASAKNSATEELATAGRQVLRSQPTTHTRCAAAPPSQKAPGAWPIEVKAEHQPRSHLNLTVSLPAAMVKRAYDEAIDNLRKNIDIGGFRKGGSKMTTDMLVRMADGGARGIKESTIESLLARSLQQALQKWEKVAFHESVAIKTPIEELVAAFDVSKPLKYQVGVDIAPTVSWKSSYRDIKVNVEAAASEESDRAAVERMLRALRKEEGTLRVVAGRGLQRGDVAIIDFDAQRAGGSDPILGAKRQNLRLDTETADHDFLPGLADGMEGMAVGDQREVAVTFPPTWEPGQLRGMAATCPVSVKEIFEWTLPELTDEFIQKAIPACSSVADAREKLFEAQQLKTAEATQRRIINALSEAVADIVEADVPQSLLNSMGENEYQAQLINMQQEGKIDMDLIQQLANEKMLAAFIEQKRDDLERMNRSVLGFEAIFQQEGLSVAEEEVQAEFDKGAQGFKDGGQQFDAEKLREQAVETVRATKVLDFLQKECTINVTPYTGA